MALKNQNKLEHIVYMDNNATTMVDPLAAEAMLHFLTEEYGNSESIHHFGGDLQYAEQEAREKIAMLFNGKPDNIYFTSGATESNNWAIKGVMKRSSKKHIITTSIEHPSVINVCKEMELNGYDVTFLPVTRDGVITVDKLAESVREDTALVSIMYANNETGAIMPIRQIGEYLKDKKIVFHCDATQAVGKLLFDINDDHIDLLSFSAHKFHGPKSVGGLYVSPKKSVADEKRPWRIEIAPYIVGGEQQNFMRGGTMNTPGIAGLGKAAELAYDYLKIESYTHKVRNLRDRLEQAIVDMVPDVIVNAQHAPRVPNTSNIIFPGAEGESIIDRLSQQGICASTGSACTSRSLAIPYVLDAMGVDHNVINSAVRFSLSRFSTEDDVGYVIQNLTQVVDELRKISGYFIKK